MYVTKQLSSYKVKILILGSNNSGKHLLCKKYFNGFGKRFDHSLGVDIYVRKLCRPDGELITLTCWACSPQKRFEYYWPKFFRGSLGAIILFDITDINSFKEAKTLLKQTRKYLGDIPIILLGNKIDLDENRVIKFEQANEFAIKERISAYVESSVKDDINVNETLELLNEIIYYLDSII